MTSTVKIQSHNYPVLVSTIDQGQQTQRQILRPTDGEVQLYTTTTRKLEILDLPTEGSDPPLSFGQRAVGLAFNPSQDERVDRIKRLYADIVDEMFVLSNMCSGEQARLSRISITEAQGAQMWAVKALTWRD